MFEKILVPLDGSELAAKILPQVVELAKAHNSQVTLIRVCLPPVPAPVPTAEKMACEGFLSKVGKELQAQGINVNWACLEGMPASEIVGYADKNKVDLIALATHGAGEIAWVLGSTAEKVLTHATAPVLLYRVLGFKPPVRKAEHFLP